MFPGASTMNQLDKVVEVTGLPASPGNIPFCIHAPLSHTLALQSVAAACRELHHV